MLVSVIVPVFEPGPTMDPLIDSLRRQTLAPDRFEVLLVDDGSQDGTPARLDALASEIANVHVEHLPHSGWPSRPRNHGLERARGTFVFFADQDDWLDPEALERLVARAEEDGADVVVGKVVGHGKAIPRALFARNRRDATLEWEHLIRLLAPHKLFRRALLMEHGVRFPEDGVRLEDHVFVLTTYFATSRVSILADHPIYHWVSHGPGVNASSARVDPPSYYGRIADLLDLIDEHVEPGATRDQVYRHYLRSKLYGRLSGARFLRRDADFNRHLFDVIRELVIARFPERLDEQLGLRYVLLGRQVRTGAFESALELAGLETGVRVDARLLARKRVAEGEHLRLEAELTFDGRPMDVVMRDVRLLWQPPGVGDEPVDVAAALQRARLQLVLRAPATRAEYPLRTRHEVRLDPVALGENRFRPVLVAEADLDPLRAAAGSPLEPGSWGVTLAASVGGFNAQTRRVRRRGAASEPKPLHVYVMQDGTLRPKGRAPRARR